MAAGRDSSFKHHKYKGMSNSQVALPENYIDDQDPEAVTISEIKNKYHHLRRVTDRTSRPTFRYHPADEVFSDVYPEFLNFYSRGQLQHLEKLFLMADQDRDGQLNSFEVKYWMEKQGNPISQREAKEIFKIADQNKDGLLSFREFLLFCQKIELKNIPSDNRQVKTQGLIEDPTGQSSKYPPRNSRDDGIGKFASKVRSFTKIRGNIGGAVQFFESEILKESRSCEFVSGQQELMDALESSFSSENIPCLENPAYIRESTIMQPESEYEKEILRRQRKRKAHIGKNECFNGLLHSWERTSSRALWEAQVSNSSQNLHRSCVFMATAATTATFENSPDTLNFQQISTNVSNRCALPLGQSSPSAVATASANVTSPVPRGVRTLIQVYENMCKTNK